MRTLLMLVGAWTLLSLALLAAMWLVRSGNEALRKSRVIRRARRCASGHHDRTAYVGTPYRIKESCVDCGMTVRHMGEVFPSAECHATVKRRDAA